MVLLHCGILLEQVVGAAFFQNAGWDEIVLQGVTFLKFLLKLYFFIKKIPSFFFFLLGLPYYLCFSSTNLNPKTYHPSSYQPIYLFRPTDTPLVVTPSPVSWMFGFRELRAWRAESLELEERRAWSLKNGKFENTNLKVSTLCFIFLVLVLDLVGAIANLIDASSFLFFIFVTSGSGWAPLSSLGRKSSSFFFFLFSFCFVACGCK